MHYYEHRKKEEEEGEKLDTLKVLFKRLGGEKQNERGNNGSETKRAAKEKEKAVKVIVLYLKPLCQKPILVLPTPSLIFVAILKLYGLHNCFG